MAMIQLMGAPEQGVPDFSVSGSLVTVAGVTVDCAARLEDGAVHVEIRTQGGNAYEGSDGAYAAVIVIPGRRYEEVERTEGEGEEAKTVIDRNPLPLDPNAVIVKLWPFAHQPAAA